MPFVRYVMKGEGVLVGDESINMPFVRYVIYGVFNLVTLSDDEHGVVGPRCVHHGARRSRNSVRGEC